MLNRKLANMYQINISLYYKKHTNTTGSESRTNFKYKTCKIVVIIIPFDTPN